MSKKKRLRRPKVYDRETKTYVEEEDHVASLKKRESCNGGKEHDWVTVLPHHVHHKDVTAEVIDKYWELCEELDNAQEEHYKKLKDLGYTSTYILGFQVFGKIRRIQVCAVCGKHKPWWK